MGHAGCQSLRFVDTGYRRHRIELRCGDDVVGTLRWTGGVARSVTATAAQGQWTFSRHGSGVDVAMPRNRPHADARFTSNWTNGGELVVGDGPRFAWRHGGPLGCGYGWRSAAPEPLLTFVSIVAWKTQVRVQVRPPADALPELPVLLFLGGYLLVYGNGGGIPVPGWMVEG